MVDFYWPEAELVVECRQLRISSQPGAVRIRPPQRPIRALAGRRTIRSTYRRIREDRAGLQEDLQRLIAAGGRERHE